MAKEFNGSKITIINGKEYIPYSQSYKAKLAKRLEKYEQEKAEKLANETNIFHYAVGGLFVFYILGFFFKNRYETKNTK